MDLHLSVNQKLGFPTLWHVGMRLPPSSGSVTRWRAKHNTSIKCPKKLKLWFISSFSVSRVLLPFKKQQQCQIINLNQQVLTLKKPFHQGTAFNDSSPQSIWSRAQYHPPSSWLLNVFHKAPELLSVTTRRECQTWISLYVNYADFILIGCQILSGPQTLPLAYMHTHTWNVVTP